MFKIEGEGRGLSYLKQTTDIKFPRTFDVIPNNNFAKTLLMFALLNGHFKCQKGALYKKEAFFS